jgi:hypothetical protein
MFRSLGKLLAVGYSLLLSVAAGGFIGANFALFVPGIADIFFNPGGRATQPVTYLRWAHGGWLVGAGVTLVGFVLQRRRFANRTADEERHRKRRHALLQDNSSSHGVLASAGIGAACCGLLGALLGGSFLLLWFSLAYSPFSPSWDRTMTVERARTLPRRRTQIVHTTQHPIALYAFFVPTVLGAASGAVIGGVTGVRRVSPMR